MAWFKQTSVKDYEKLVKTENKMYNITPQFSAPELLNKYKDEDDIVNKKIQLDEELNKQNENLSKAIDKNLNKYLEEKEGKSKYKGLYTSKNNIDILHSFIKIFNDYYLSYKPRTKTKVISSQYLLNKLEKPKKISSELFRYFDENLRNKEKIKFEISIKET